jgi:hypothetical protein
MGSKGHDRASRPRTAARETTWTGQLYSVEVTGSFLSGVVQR